MAQRECEGCGIIFRSPYIDWRGNPKRYCTTRCRKRHYRKKNWERIREIEKASQKRCKARRAKYFESIRNSADS